MGRSCELFRVSAATPDDAFAHGKATAHGTAHATAELRRGIDLSAGVSLEGHVGGQLGRKIAVALEAAGRLDVEAALQAKLPLDLFDEAGLVARFLLEASASASVGLELKLPVEVFHELARDREGSTLRPLVDVFFEEVEVEAGLWGRASFAAEIGGGLVATGTLLPTAPGGAGFTIASHFGVGLGYGAGAHFLANLGFQDPRRLVTRLGDATGKLLVQQAKHLVTSDGGATRYAVTALELVIPLASRCLFQLGLELATGGDAKKALRLVGKQFVEQARTLLLGALGDLAVGELDRLLASEAGGDVAVAERKAFVRDLGRVRDALAELKSGDADGPEHFLGVLLDCLPTADPLIGLLPERPAGDVRRATAILWSAGSLIHRAWHVAEHPEDLDGALFAGVAAPLPSASGLGTHVAATIGKPAGSALTLADLVTYLVGADLEAELRARVPEELAKAIAWIEGALSTPRGELVRSLLVDLADPERSVADALSKTVAAAVEDVIEQTIVPHLLQPLAAGRAADDPVRLLVEELATPLVIALPEVVLAKLPDLATEKGRLRVREAISAVLLQSLGRFTAVSVDILLDHALKEGEKALRKAAVDIPHSKYMPVIEAAAMLAPLPLKPLLPDDVKNVLELAADLARRVNRDERAAIADALRLALTVGLSSATTREASLRKLTDTDEPGQVQQLEAILKRLEKGSWDLMKEAAPRLLELYLLHFVYEAEAIARLVEDGAKKALEGVEELVAFLEKEVTRLEKLASELAKQVEDLVSRMAADGAELSRRLRGLADYIIDEVRNWGLSLLDPLIKHLPGWAKKKVRAIYFALFEPVRAVLKVPLTILGEVAGWVQGILEGLLDAASLDEASVRGEIRQRIIRSGAADIRIDLGLKVAGKWIFRVPITIPGAAVMGIVADAVLREPLLAQIIGQGARLRQVKGQQATVAQQLSGALTQKQAKAEAARLAPGMPLQLRFGGVADGDVAATPAQVRIRLEGANRTFVTPTLGVPPRVRVTINSVPYDHGGAWVEDASGIELAIRIAAAPAPVRALLGAPTTIEVASLRLPTSVSAVPRGRGLEFLVEAGLEAEPDAGSEGAEPEEFPDGPALREAARLLRARQRRDPTFAAAVEAVGEVRATTRPVPPAVTRRVAVTGPDGAPQVDGLVGLNLVEVSAADGKGRQAHGRLSFFLHRA